MLILVFIRYNIINCIVMGLCVVVVKTMTREQLMLYCAHTSFNCWLMLVGLESGMEVLQSQVR